MSKRDKIYDLLDSLKEGAYLAGTFALGTLGLACEGAEKLAEGVKLRCEAARVEGEMDGKLMEAGEMVYATHTGKPSDSEDMQEILEYIDGLYEQLEGRERALRELEGLARTCVCGAENPPETGFCRTCGRPL